MEEEGKHQEIRELAHGTVVMSGAEPTFLDNKTMHASFTGSSG